MKLVDRIDSEEKVKELTEKEKESLFVNMLTGKDVETTIKTSKGDFVLKYPIAKDLLAIGRLMTFRRGGISPQAFDSVTERVILTTSTLDIIVVSGPDWYENAKKANNNFTFLEVPDDKFVEELYQKAYSFCDEVHRRFEEESGTADREVPAETGAHDTLGGGLFKNIADKFRNKESD